MATHGYYVPTLASKPASHVSGCVGAAGDITVSRIQHVSVHKVEQWMVTQHVVQLFVK